MSLATVNNITRRGLTSIERRALFRTDMGLADDTGKAKEELRWSKRMQAIRSWNHHNRTGSIVQMQMHFKKRLFHENYRKKRGKKEVAFLKEYSNLEKVGAKDLSSELGLMHDSLNRVKPVVEKEMLRIFQSCLVEQYRDPGLSLITTHIYFAGHSSLMLVVNMNHQYAYTKIVTNKGIEVPVYHAQGPHRSWHPETIKGMVKFFTNLVKYFRAAKVKKLNVAMKRRKRGKVEGALFEDTEQGDVTHAIDFAESSGAAGDLPADLAATVQIERDEVQRQKERAKAVVPVEEDAVKKRVNVLLPEEDFELLDPSEFVRPLFAVFVEPFLHHTVPEQLRERLPESSGWVHRCESSGLEGTRLLRPLNLMLPGEHTQLHVKRTQFPAPPPEVSTITPSTGKSMLYGNSYKTVNWSDQRSAYQREWKENWKLGWTPQQPVPGSVPTPVEAKFEAPKDLQGGVYLEPTNNPFFVK